MRAITFNQLQLRLLISLFLVFTLSVFSYRYFIELPKLEQSIAKLTERELDILKFSITRKFDSLSRVTFDYAVWTSTYEFMRNINSAYIEENILINTFVSLGVDGIIYLDKHLQPILSTGYHRSQATEMQFSFFDFEQYPKNISLLPNAIIETGAPIKLGFLMTQHGPAMYCTTQIRDSAMKGENRGFLIMVKLLEQDFVDALSKHTLTSITFMPLPMQEGGVELRVWDESTQQVEIEPTSALSLNDDAGFPVAVLKMTHSIGKVPDLINEQSAVFIALMSLFMYLVYRLVAVAIIVPVKKLAIDLKDRDNSNRYMPLDDNYHVIELKTLSENVNALMAMVQQQNDILSQQANSDQLTKLLNRRGLINALELHKGLCIRNQIGFAVVMVDIDHFKLYNDCVGHLQGDKALFEVAQLLDMHCQRNNDICARYGGEEFTMVFTDMSEQQLCVKLNHIIKAIHHLAMPHPSSPTAKCITISMGATLVKASDVVNFELSLNNVFKVADNALYQAKHDGRDGFVVKPLL